MLMPFSDLTELLYGGIWVWQSIDGKVDRRHPTARDRACRPCSGVLVSLKLSVALRMGSREKILQDVEQLQT